MSEETKNDRRKIKEQLDECLAELQIAVVKQLLLQVNEGENLRAAIDFLRLNRRSVTESDVLGSQRDASGYLDDLLETMETSQRLRR